MATPFENGKRNGQWTRAQVRLCGFSSAQECLEHQEHVYQQELAKLPGLRPALAQRQAEYLEGEITATRETLRALIREEEQPL